MKEIGIKDWNKHHDISGWFKWLGSQNVSEKKPDLQALEKRLSYEYTKLERELDGELETINSVTDKLIKAKLTGPKWLQWLKSKAIKYFGTRSIYNHIYGNLIDIQVGVDPETKRKYTDMKLISREEMESRFAKGELIQEEVGFYNMFSGYTKKYAGISAKERGEIKLRDGYIPHVNSHALEVYSSRGLLTAFMMSRGGKTNPNVRQVVIRARDPLSQSGAMKTAEFGYFEDAYKKIDSKTGARNTVAYIKLKAKANNLYKKGQNYDGSPIELSYVSRDTLLNGSWMDRFSSSRSVKAEELPTFDLNHALTAYVKASAWKYGTVKEKGESDFQGFDRLAAHIDGIIRLNQKHGNANTAELTKKVLWDKMLMGKNQVSFLGEKGDMVVDALNWATTVVALGFKASIAVGNVMFGKYSNIRAEGGKEWIVGEKRFWGIDGDGNFMEGIRKAQAILKRYQLVDKNNMYDIGWSNKRNLGGIVTDLSLIAMTISENWIQGSHFLGMFTQEEWNSYDKNGKLKPGHKPLDEKRIAQIQYDVRRVHGRGYSALDQRMIGLYSLTRSAQMFKKWLLTNYNERFGDEMINMYGEKEIGSMRQFGNMILAGFRGEIPMNQLRAYYDSLPEHQKRAFERAVRGMGMIIALSAFAMALGDSDEEKEIKRNVRKVIGDANIFYNPDKVSKMTKIYPYYTVRYLAKTSESAFGQARPEHIVR